MKYVRYYLKRSIQFGLLYAVLGFVGQNLVITILQ